MYYQNIFDHIKRLQLYQLYFFGQKKGFSSAVISPKDDSVALVEYCWVVQVFLDSFCWSIHQRK